MRFQVIVLAASVVGGFTWSPLCVGQWSGDPAANLVVADRSGPQVETKLAATADGGFYLAWLDDSTGGYDVYLQRLDAAGVEQWAHNGVLVADRSADGTMSWGLAVDAAGYAVLAFNDDRTGSDEITVARIDPNGTAVWGPSGVQVSSGGGFIAYPCVAGTSDGNIVVAWTQDDSVALQKLDPNGTPLWGSGVTLTPSTESFILNDVIAADAGTVIVSFIHGGWEESHLWAQKLAATDGQLLWGVNHLVVFDALSLQTGYRPALASDGAGGAVVTWYTSIPLQCRVQHVLGDGAEAFAHQGVEVSTYVEGRRTNPSGAYLPATGEVVVFWKEESPPNLFGVYGQKLDAFGERQWGDTGRELVPLGVNEVDEVVTLPFDDGAIVAWEDGVAWDNQPIRAARVDGNGDLLWPSGIIDLASSQTENRQLVGAFGAAGFAAFAWAAGDTMSSDILAQNLNGDGSLGSLIAFADGFESGDTSAWSATVP